MTPRILYGLAGETPRRGDADAAPGLEPWREGMNTLFNALVFDNAPRTRYPGHSTPVPSGAPCN